MAVITALDHQPGKIAMERESIQGEIRVAWVRKDLKDHSVPSSAVGWLPTTSSGCPALHPAWPKAVPGMGHPQLL